MPLFYHFLYLPINIHAYFQKLWDDIFQYFICYNYFQTNICKVVNISIFKMKNKSFRNILNKIDPIAEPCGLPLSNADQ